ncbi:MAG TPA: DHA2 family efflux MFS transporter permease subunit [Solirubrobacteraceae bacterium]|nr:DHA2 family efflux MFS transporter permease subunit [Solirubrobacteraceae bacterium]
MTGTTLEMVPEAGLADTTAGTRRHVSTPRAVLAVAVLGCFMAFVDATIVNIAVPDIARHFSATGLSSVSWVLNAYNIVFAAFLVGGGQLADLLGRRRVFCSAVLLFTLASALCALSSSLSMLIAARAIQAAGAAALVPSSLAIVLEAHDARERMHAVALWSAVAALAAGIGPPLGGLLITASSWRLVFLVNIPVGLVAFLLAGRVLVESRAPGRRYMPDVRGGVVLALAIASLVLAVVKGQEWGWGNGRVLGAFVAAALLIVHFVIRSSRQRTPVVDLSMLRIRAFALSNGATVVMASGFYAYTLCNVLFLTIAWRYSILDAGLALTPGPFVAIAVAGPASRLVERVGHRRVVVPGALVWAAGMLYFATQLGMRPHFLGEWLPGMVVLGIGAGLTFPTLSGAAVGSVPGPRFAVATSLNSVARQVGAALGVAILTAILGNPSRVGALRAFEHGWLFAGTCFLIGSLSCLGLVVTRPSTRETLTDEARESLEESARALVEGELLDDRSLPRLSDSHGEQAVIARQSVAEFLRNVPVFAPLSDTMRAEIAELASAVSLKRDEWLFREHDPADCVYVVRLGQLEVVREGSEPETVNTITRGAVLGELALLGDSSRNASVRALRDTELLQITRPHFESLLRSEPELTLSLARALGAQLKGSRVIPPRRGRPVTLALYALGDGVPLIDLADELSRMLCTWGRVAVLHPGETDGLTAALEREPGESMSRHEAVARFTPLVERCELEHDQVILVCGSPKRASGWDEFCLARADRVLVAVDAVALHPPVSHTRECPSLRGCDLLGYGVERGSASLTRWIAELAPASTFAVRAGVHRHRDMARVARRLAGRAVGVVLSGGGARAFAHIGVLETLHSAGVVIDRVGGVSMGAFIGGLLACGHGSDAIDAYCYEEWVRRNPMNDYTLPRNSLIKGEKARAMLERVYGDVRIEELDRAFYSASVDLRRSSLVIERDGPVFLAVGSSMAMPLIVPPQLRAERLLIDGSLLDNLPLAPMTFTGEGPVLAIDVKGGMERGRPDAADSGETDHRDRDERRVRLPSLTGTMYRIALLSSANTAEAARLHADFTVEVRVPTVGLFEFHQIDEARAAGRRAASQALEDPPPWLLPEHGRSSLAGRRTVVAV